MTPSACKWEMAAATSQAILTMVANGSLCMYSPSSSFSRNTLSRLPCSQYDVTNENGSFWLHAPTNYFKNNRWVISVIFRKKKMNLEEEIPSQYWDGWWRGASSQPHAETRRPFCRPTYQSSATVWSPLAHLAKFPDRPTVNQTCDLKVEVPCKLFRMRPCQSFLQKWDHQDRFRGSHIRSLFGATIHEANDLHPISVRRVRY